MGKMATAWQVHALLALYPHHTNCLKRTRVNISRKMAACLLFFPQALYLEVGLHCIY